jgi:hypothetical protein
MDALMSAVVYRQEDLVIFSHRGLFGSVWWSAPTVPNIQAVHAARLHHEKTHPGSFVMLSLLKLSRMRSMSADVKEQTKEVRKGLEVNCRADANVIEPSVGALGESIVRMAFTAINLINRSTVPNKLFTNPSDAIGWLASFSTVSADDMLRIVDSALNKS